MYIAIHTVKYPKQKKEYITICAIVKIKRCRWLQVATYNIILKQRPVTDLQLKFLTYQARTARQ